MANTYKSLGQSAPGEITETTLYTVPGATSAVVSNVTVCNRANSSATFRISHAVGGGVTANQDYLAYDVTIYANETITLTLGIAMATTDKLKVYRERAWLLRGWPERQQRNTHRRHEGAHIQYGIHIPHSHGTEA